MSNTIPGIRVVHEIEGTKDVIEDYTGSRPVSCPWFAFNDPIVSDAVRLRPLLESGQYHLVLGDHPPAILIDAIVEYESALNGVQAKQWRKKEREREQERKRREAANRPGLMAPSARRRGGMY